MHSDNTIIPLTEPVVDVLAGSYVAADVIAAKLIEKVDERATLIAASFVNINNLEETSPLGRLLSEQMSSRMAQNGFRVLELKLRLNSIYIKEGQGEFLLSRDIQKIGESHSSNFVIVGTYTVAVRSIYVCVRIVNTFDNTVITGYDFQLARTFETDSLLIEE